MRNYRRMNYGKELIDKVINMTNIKPVLMAFEFPNKSMMNFLEHTYGLSNPIYQANNVITFYQGTTPITKYKIKFQWLIKERRIDDRDWKTGGGDAWNG